jgi:hypothetical protein
VFHRRPKWCNEEPEMGDAKHHNVQTQLKVHHKYNDDVGDQSSTNQTHRREKQPPIAFTFEINLKSYRYPLGNDIEARHAVALIMLFATLDNFSDHAMFLCTFTTPKSEIHTSELTPVHH